MKADTEAQHNMVIRMPATDLARAHALASDHNEPISVLVRRWIREAYRTRFGDTTPEAPTLRNGERLKLPKQK